MGLRVTIIWRPERRGRIKAEAEDASAEARRLRPRSEGLDEAGRAGGRRPGGYRPAAPLNVEIQFEGSVVEGERLSQPRSQIKYR